MLLGSRTSRGICAEVTGSDRVMWYASCVPPTEQIKQAESWHAHQEAESHARWARERRRRASYLVRPLFVLSALLGLIAVGSHFTDSIIDAVRRRYAEGEQAPVEQVESELSKAQAALTDAMRKASTVAEEMVKNSKKQQDEISTLRSRYDSLKALTAGQEEIARTYRSILLERPWRERLVDQGFGFLVGVLSSLAASWLWARFAESKR